MNCLAEALGLALPGNGTILAVSKERESLYRWAARQILKLVKLDLKPRDIATPEAFDNALALDVAMGGSTNTILHTLAIAREAGIAYDIARIDAISRRVPCLCKVSPSSDYHVQDVHRAGGIHTILGELLRLDEANGYLGGKHQGPGAPARERILNPACRTVTGKTLGENIADWDIRSPAALPVANVIRVSGASALVLDPADKLGPAARAASGNLVPKPMMFLPADERAIELWRLAAAWNVGASDALGASSRGAAPGLARLVRGVKRQLDILGRGAGDFTNLLAGDGRYILKILAANRSNPLAANEVIVARLDNLLGIQLIHGNMLHAFLSSSVALRGCCYALKSLAKLILLGGGVKASPSPVVL